MVAPCLRWLSAPHLLDRESDCASTSTHRLETMGHRLRFIYLCQPI